MVLCERCGKHNEDYCNYCSDEGNEMSTFERKLILNENENKYCDGCGHETKSNQIYCSECGKLLSQVGKRRKTKRKITQNTGNINNPSLGSINEATGAMAKEAKKIFGDLPSFFGNTIDELKSFNYVSFAQNNITTALKTDGISIVLMLIYMFIQLQLGDSLLNELVEDTSMELSSFKQVVFGIASMNAPKIVINALFNTVNVSIAARIIITPIITGFIIYLVTRFIYSKTEVKSLPTAVLCALVYAAIITVISLFARVNVSEDLYTNIKIYISVFSVFINSFIISFIANILALEKQNSKKVGTLSNIFKNNLFILGATLLAFTIIFLAWMYIKVGSFTEILRILKARLAIGGYIDSYNDILGFSGMKLNIIWFVYMVIIGLMMSSWLILMSHLVAIKFATLSVSLFSFVEQGEGMWILLILIPIATLIIIGRMIKKRHGEENHNIIGIYSISYTAIMGLISYFSTITISGNATEDLISLISSFTTSSGSVDFTLGTNLFATIITVFIFSTVFMYIGYKTKKIEN